MKQVPPSSSTSLCLLSSHTFWVDIGIAVHVFDLPVCPAYNCRALVQDSCCCSQVRLIFVYSCCFGTFQGCLAQFPA